MLLSGWFLLRTAARRLSVSLLKAAPRTQWLLASAERKSSQQPFAQDFRIAERRVSDPRPNTLCYFRKFHQLSRKIATENFHSPSKTNGVTGDEAHQMGKELPPQESDAIRTAMDSGFAGIEG